MGRECSTYGVNRFLQGLVGDLREGEHLENPRSKWGDNIKADLREVGWETWTGWIWLKIGVGDRLL
jgi:hypothetical protein